MRGVSYGRGRRVWETTVHRCILLPVVSVLTYVANDRREIPPTARSHVNQKALIEFEPTPHCCTITLTLPFDMSTPQTISRSFPVPSLDTLGMGSFVFKLCCGQTGIPDSKILNYIDRHSRREAYTFLFSKGSQAGESGILNFFLLFIVLYFSFIHTDKTRRNGLPTGLQPDCRH